MYEEKYFHEEKQNNWLPGLKAHSIIQESLFKQTLFVKINEYRA